MTMALTTWLIYFVAIIGLSLTPGPNGLLALTHGALYGPNRAVLTVLGGVTGFTALMAASMFGLGALLQASVHALTVLKWLGGAYLVWLGIQLWRAPAMHLTLAAGASVPHAKVLIRQGFLTAVSNPKVLLFFGAFLPQFIDLQQPLPLQFVLMAMTFAAVEGLVEYLLARLAGRIQPRLERSGRGFNRVCGAMFAFMGIALPVAR